MFSDNDYLEYFDQIASLERLMVYRSNDLLLELEDEKIRREIEGICRDEERHYAYIRGVFDTILFKDVADKRNFRREHSLGKVQVTFLGTGVSFEAYCVDISSSGICVESEHAFDYEGDVEFTVALFSEPVSRVTTGKMVWRSKVGSQWEVGRAMFKAGFEFA